MQQYDFIKKDTIHGFRPVMKDGKRGLIDLNGQTVLPTIYKTIKDINEHGCATVVFIDPDTNEEYEGYVLINKQ